MQMIGGSYAHTAAIAALGNGSMGALGARPFYIIVPMLGATRKVEVVRWCVHRQGSDERLSGLPLQLGSYLLRLRRRPPPIADAQELSDASFQALHQWPPLRPADVHLSAVANCASILLLWRDQSRAHTERPIQSQT